MTNEEIIDGVSGNDVIYIEAEVIKFMDAAREDEAVGFKMWCDNNLWVTLAPGLYAKVGGQNITGSNSISLKELYQLYKQKK